MDQWVIGFTGTHHGMTPAQAKEVRALLVSHRPDLFVHGACIGADDEADAIAAGLGIWRHVYPSTAKTRVPDSVMTGAARLGSGVTIFAPAAPLVRDKEIVLRANMLLAAPRGRVELRRSGTWATIRYARKRGIPITIVGPDGEGDVVVEPGTR